jgi:hypothetical protein
LSWKIIDRKITEREKQGKTSVVRKAGKELSEKILVKERQRHGATAVEDLFETGVLDRGFKF